MKKNIFIRTASLILASAVILTAAGCKGKSDQKDSDLKQPAVEGGTAVVEFTTVNEKGEEVNATKVNEVNDKLVNRVTTGSGISDELKDDEAKKDFVEDKDDYGISDEQADEIIKNAKDWKDFTFNIYVANNNAKRVAFKNLDVKPTEDILIEKELDCEYGVAPGAGMTITLRGMVNSAKYRDPEELKLALQDMNIKIQYTFLEKDQFDVDDWEDVTTSVMPVKVNG